MKMKSRLLNAFKFKARINDYFKQRKNNFSFSSTKSKKINRSFLIPLLFSPFFLSKSIIYLNKEKENDSQKLLMKELIRGEYENKIRMFAALEKKYMIFAGINSVDKGNMSYFQFLDCIIPFQHMKTLPLEEIEDKLKNNKIFTDTFNKIDINNDKLISFEEFVIWNLIISLNCKELEKKFPSGKLTKEDFANYLMDNLRNYEKMRVTDKAAVDARLVKTDHETIFKALVDLTSKYFKNNQIDIKKEINQLVVDMSLVGYIYEVILIYS